MNGPACPQCDGAYSVKNGHAHTGKQRYLCRVCGYQFTLDSTWHRISPEKEALVDRLLTERITHRGICRVTGVSRSWFRRHLMTLEKTVPHGLQAPEPPSKKV